MSIRIQNDGIAGAAASQISQTSGPAQNHSSSSAASKGLGGSDQVDLSSLSGAVSNSVSAMASKQADRVSQLTALYAKGQYQVDPIQLSRSLISEAINAGMVGAGS
jgi:anti-sigma28 factor (negative regulator of flagellin synthesis)